MEVQKGLPESAGPFGMERSRFASANGGVCVLDGWFSPSGAWLHFWGHMIEKMQKTGVSILFAPLRTAQKSGIL